MKRWKLLLGLLAALLLAGAGAVAWLVLDIEQELERVGADPARGFHWPYYLYVAESAARRAGTDAPLHVLVVPNNTGTGDDDIEVHRRSARLRAMHDSRLAERLEVALLVPVFPRPATNWRVYTHALDRDSLTTELAGLERLDLQLLAMLDDARERLATRGFDVAPKALLSGYSASGMFANRFAVLHPERVLAAAAGSPGGWPIAPLVEWRGERLRYPVGVADLEALAGRPFDAEAFQRVPLFIYMGDADENDSVVFGDGYDEPDKETVFRLFGPTPVSRWDAVSSIYAAATERAELRLYPGIAHALTNEMAADVEAFLSRALRDAGAR